MNEPAKSAAFDWETAKARLARLAQTLSESEKLSPERNREVLAERARQLARVPPAATDSHESLEVLVFRLGQERLAIETEFVHEVAPLAHITPAPNAPEILAGLTNLRGEVLAVFDVRRLLGIGGANEPGAPALVVGEGRREFVLLTDQIEEVATWRLDEIVEAPASVAGTGRDLLRGVTRHGVLVLAGRTLVKDQRLFVSEEG